MLDSHEALNGVSTTAYAGRQRQAQALAAAVQEKTRILTRTYQRDNRLLWALAVMTTLLLLSGAANLWQGRTGVEQVPYVVLVDHLGNHAPLLTLADQPVTPEQSIIVGTLMTWLEHVRMISSDRVVLGKNWDRVEDYTSQAALQQLEGFRREQKQRQQLGRRVEITPPRLLPIQKARAYTAAVGREDLRSPWAAPARGIGPVDRDTGHCRFSIPGGPAGTGPPSQTTELSQPAGDCGGRRELAATPVVLPGPTSPRRINVWPPQPPSRA